MELHPISSDRSISNVHAQNAISRGETAGNRFRTILWLTNDRQIAEAHRLRNDGPAITIAEVRFFPCCLSGTVSVPAVLEPERLYTGDEQRTVALDKPRATDVTAVMDPQRTSTRTRGRHITSLVIVCHSPPPTALSPPFSAAVTLSSLSGEPRFPTGLDVRSPRGRSTLGCH